MIYLDNAATTRVCPEAAAAAARAFTEQFGNPSSLHTLGQEAECVVTAAREIVAQKLGAAAREIYFTSGATEGNNLAILGGVALKKHKGKHVIVGMTEHPSVLAVIDALESRGRITVDRLPPSPQGGVDAGAVLAALRGDTVLVSLMHANNETGAVTDIEAVGRALREKDPAVLLHCDCVQSFLRLPLSAAAGLFDFITVSAHKIHGPKGIGALYVRGGVPLKPQFFGGGQERGLRPGTENVPGAAGFGAAVNAFSEGAAARLGALARGKLAAAFADIVFHSKQDASLPHILNFSLPGVKSEVAIHMLEAEGIYLSSGSACARGKQSHVLAAMGLPKALSDCALRVSFSAENSEGDVDALVDALIGAAKRLRR